MILLMNSAYAFSGEVTSVYGWRIHPIFGIGKGHEGVDIAVPTGVGVPSLATGTVVYSGWCGGYGYFISVQDANGVCWNMGHNSQLLYPVGTHVVQGQVIAISGSTGKIQQARTFMLNADYLMFLGILQIRLIILLVSGIYQVGTRIIVLGYLVILFQILILISVIILLRAKSC